MNSHEIYMHRCLQLAQSGEGYVAPNPMVGSVLVYEDKIIGEGYHHVFGEAHAEVNCINSVSEKNKDFIPLSTLYVSLEPCAHFGKTPPCTDFIIAAGIKKVVVGCQDTFKKVDGKGITQLKQAGIEVMVPVLENKCRELNRMFFTFHNKQRPFILLKWAESGDHFIGSIDSRLHISNEFSNRFVHQLRAGKSAILIGTNTALKDNPSLTTRLAAGPSPIRLVIDLQKRLPVNLKIFDDSQRTIIFTLAPSLVKGNVEWFQLNDANNIAAQIAAACFKLNIQSILVEGGAQTLQTFINEQLWDEAIIIKNTTMHAGSGVAAPKLSGASLHHTQLLENDLISFYNRTT